MVVRWPFWLGERASKSGCVDGSKRLGLTVRNASGVAELAVDSSSVVKVAPSSRESLGLFDHERCPFLRVSVEHQAEPLVAVVTDVSTTAPHCVADLHGSLVALLPFEPSRAKSVANSRDAPVDPVIACDVVGPEMGLCVPCIDVTAQGVLEYSVGFIVVVCVGCAGVRAGCAVVVSGTVGTAHMAMGLKPPRRDNSRGACRGPGVATAAGS